MDEISAFGEWSSRSNGIWWRGNGNHRPERIDHVVGEYDEHQQRPLGREKLDEIRKLFFEGNLAEATTSPETRWPEVRIPPEHIFLSVT